jgi:hypothetical protein
VGDERRTPEVTVRDPSRPARPADVLVSGEDEPRPSPFTPRRLRAAGALLAVAAAAVGVVELRERRAAAAEERRLDRVLELAVEPRGSGSSYDPATGAAELDLQLSLRNTGPRDVVVERGAVGEYVLVQDVVQVSAGGDAPLLLRRTVVCSPTSPPQAAPLDVLRLDLRTAAGPRQLELPLVQGLVRDEAARACGFVPLEEAVDVRLLDLVRQRESVQLSLDLSSRSLEPVALAAVDAGPGLRAELTLVENGSTDLPLALPPDRRDGTRRGTSMEVRVTVVDCALARTARPQVELQVVDEAQRVAQVSFDYDPAFLGTLLSDACPS